MSKITKETMRKTRGRRSYKKGRRNLVVRNSQTTMEERNMHRRHTGFPAEETAGVIHDAPIGTTGL